MFISGSDNVIRPYFISRGAQLPFLLTLLGVLGGALAFGLLGIFLGPSVVGGGVHAWLSSSPGRQCWRSWTRGPRAVAALAPELTKLTRVYSRSKRSERCRNPPFHCQDLADDNAAIRRARRPFVPGRGCRFHQHHPCAGAREMWAVLSVETSGCGFLDGPASEDIIRTPSVSWADRGAGMTRPIRISANRPPAATGRAGPINIRSLAEAIALDPRQRAEERLLGVGPGDGAEFRTWLGSPTVQAMVDAMVDSEDAQLGAMAAFLVANHLDTILVAP